MRKRVEEFIRENELFFPGEKILAAVSGGADSICLLHILIKLQREWDLQLRAVHVNHQLRPGEAERDEAFVKEFCEKYSVDVICRRVEVQKFAQEKGWSEEEAGRILRYQIFEEEAKRWEDGDREAKTKKPVRIAVAHHRDDNVETILFQLFRGSGLKGLGGIAAVRGRVIRPLLAVGRREIVEYLREEGLDFCEDSTNRSEEYSRNRIRLNVIPMIEAEANSRAAEHILQAAKHVRQADAYLEEQAARWLERYGTNAEKDKLPLKIGADAKKLCNEAEIIQAYVIWQMMEAVSGTKKDLGRVHVEAVQRLLQSQVGKRVDLPYGLTAERSYTKLWIVRGEGKDGEREGDKEIFLPKVEMEVFSYEKDMKIPQNQYTKWFDCDKINGALSVRTRQTGDYFLLPGGGRKTIKSYMVDEKIPAERRGRIPLLADGSHILWIIGKRISEGCKVTDKTKKVLQVHVREADGKHRDSGSRNLSKGEENG